jgi:hypothetical protein
LGQTLAMLGQAAKSREIVNLRTAQLLQFKVAKKRLRSRVIDTSSR